ncbi:MAG: DNA polymerase IV [Acholeplasmatales bacterium]|nr:DNA polymerase IV [Acholeplasmatales bacterium]
MLKNYKGRIIFHIDMNAYFCSVHCKLNPTLRGKAFAVGREGTYKGVLSTASYEARKLGIHSAMPIIEAYKILPTLLVVNSNYEEYKKYHYLFVNIIREYTNLIEVASIDELYADMTEISEKIHPVVLAKEIQLRLLRELDLPCSIGIAPTLFLAKMASDMKKPLGLTVLRKREIKEKLYPLSVKDIFGIGKKTYPKLIDAGINTIEDFMNPGNEELIIKLIGNNSYSYAKNCILGKSSNEVIPDRYNNSKSISTETTFDIHKDSLVDILSVLRSLLRDIHGRLVKGEYVTKTVVLTMRDSQFNTISRRKTIDEYTDDIFIFNNLIEDLLNELMDETKSYRLVGVGFSNIIKRSELKEEYNLFTINDKTIKENNIKKLMKDINNKFGDDIIYFNKDKKK